MNCPFCKTTAPFLAIEAAREAEISQGASILGWPTYYLHVCSACGRALPNPLGIETLWTAMNQWPTATLDDLANRATDDPNDTNIDDPFFEPIPKRKRGRPKGSKNKPKQQPS